MSRIDDLRLLLTGLRSCALVVERTTEQALDLAARLSDDMGFEAHDGSRLTRDAYQKLIAEDIAWLRAQPRTLERDHIVLTLEWSLSALYGRLAPRCKADGYKDGRCVNLAEDGFCRLPDCSGSQVRPPDAVPATVKADLTVDERAFRRDADFACGYPYDDGSFCSQPRGHATVVPGAHDQPAAPAVLRKMEAGAPLPAAWVEGQCPEVQNGIDHCLANKDHRGRCVFESEGEPAVFARRLLAAELTEARAQVVELRRIKDIAENMAIEKATERDAIAKAFQEYAENTHQLLHRYDMRHARPTFAECRALLCLGALGALAAARAGEGG